MRMEDRLVFVNLFLGRIVLRLYVTRVLLVVTMVTVERMEIIHTSNEIELKYLKMDAAEVSFSTASHIQ